MEEKDLQKQIDTLKKEKANLEKLNQDLNAEVKALTSEKEQLQTQIEKDQASFEEKEQAQAEQIESLKAIQEEFDVFKKDMTIDSVIRDSKAKNVKAIRALLDFDQINVTENGEVEGLKEQIEAVKKTDAYLFDLGTQQEYNPNQGQADQPRVEMPKLNEFRIVK